MVSNRYSLLYGLIESLPVISSHEHLLPDPLQQDLDLDRLLENSYLHMLHIPPGQDALEHARFLEQVRHNSFFVWLEKSLQRIYGFGEKLTAENWETVSRMVRSRHNQPDACTTILRENAGYRRAIQDAYWDYGSDNGHPEMLTPTLRTDMFVSVFHPDCSDHDGNSPFKSYPDIPTGSFDDYLAYVEALFSRWRERGAVALKSVMAYERKIQFDPASRAEAAKIFLRPPTEVTPADRMVYGNFMFGWFCELARRLEVPFQVHTGLARLSGSDPMLLEPVIADHPGTRFVLFHAGYPWYDSVAGLAHTYANVYVDMVWVPHVSPTGAVQALHEILEGIPSNERIGWGGDARTGEEAYGALLAWRHVLARVLSEKVEEGYFDLAEAKILAHKLLYSNVAKLYGLAS